VVFGPRNTKARVHAVELPGDLLTPFGVFCLLDQEQATGGDAFLFEGALGRYSYVGVGSGVSRFTVRGGVVEDAQARAQSGSPGSPLEALRTRLQQIAIPHAPGLPPFCGGLAGYLGWATSRWSESLPQRLGPDPLFPDADMLHVRELVSFDHRAGRAWAVASGDGAGQDSPESRAQALAARVLRVFSSGSSHPKSFPSQLLRAAAPPMIADGKRLEALLTPLGGGRKKFLANVKRALEYIRAGDVFQVVLSQRFELPDCDGFSLYRTLRRASPSPYHFYLRIGGRELFGASPELLVQVEGDAVAVRPIAGTRKRGATFAEDQALEASLRADPKERAEHTMLVDLGRNDIGKVSAIGSVKVPRLLEIERFSHVMHLVSEVTGTLRPGLSSVDAFAAAFPAGTLSGAPKIRALQIIDELEPVARGPYGGAVGWFSGSGDAQLAIAIRTLLRSGGRLFAHAGAGIVADSDPVSEWNEVQAKVRASVLAASGARANANEDEGGLR
jgi:anthranilate synthase component 1